MPSTEPKPEPKVTQAIGPTPDSETPMMELKPTTPPAPKPRRSPPVATEAQATAPPATTEPPPLDPQLEADITHFKVKQDTRRFIEKRDGGLLKPKPPTLAQRIEASALSRGPADGPVRDGDGVVTA